MADDVALMWVTLDDSRAQVTKGQVRQLVLDLGLPQSVLSKESTLAAFKSACTDTKTKYPGEDGSTRLLLARPAARKSEMVTYDVLRDDGVKMASLKYFQARRTDTGTVMGSQRVMTTRRKNLSPTDSDGLEVWLDAALQVYADLGTRASTSALRRVVRTGMSVRAVPMVGRTTMYFTYPDGIQECLKIKEFLRRLPDVDSQFDLVTVRGDSPMRVFAQAADAFVLPKAQAVIDRIEGWADQDPRNRRNLRASLKMWRDDVHDVETEVAMHQSHLHLALPSTRELLDLADRMMTGLSPSPSLQASHGD